VRVELIEFYGTGKEKSYEHSRDKGRPCIRIPMLEVQHREGDIEADVHNNIQPEFK